MTAAGCTCSWCMQVLKPGGTLSIFLHVMQGLYRSDCRLCRYRKFADYRYMIRLCTDEPWLVGRLRGICGFSFAINGQVNQVIILYNENLYLSVRVTMRSQCGIMREVRWRGVAPIDVAGSDMGWPRLHFLVLAMSYQVHIRIIFNLPSSLHLTDCFA